MTAPVWTEGFSVAELTRIADTTTDQAVRVDALTEITRRRKGAR